VDLTSALLYPFTIPIVVVIIMAVLQALLMLVAGIDFDLDLDHDADLDIDIDHDVDVDHDIDFSLARFLSPIGVGQVPLSIIWYAYALSFGISGLAASYALAQYLVISPWFFFATIPLSLVMGWHATKRAVKAVIPLVKTSGVAETQRCLLGRRGIVTSTKVDRTFGEAVFKKSNVEDHIVVISDVVIEKDSPIVVVDFDEESGRPIVKPFKVSE